MRSLFMHGEMSRIQSLASIVAIVIGLVAVVLSGCTSGHGGYELDKAEEDREVMKSSDKCADEILQSHPEYLTDIDAITTFAEKVEKRCRPEEVPQIRAALLGCRDAISNATSEEVRRVRFRKLYEFEYREFLRWTHRRAREIADELCL